MLGALTAIGPLSIDRYLPALPSMAHEFGVSTGEISTTLPAYFCGLAIGQLIDGSVSDRFGRKPPLYFVLILFFLASLACILATHLEFLIIARVAQALGGCVGMVIVRAAIRDRLSPAESAKAFSNMMLIMGVAPILAPLLGGWFLVHLDWHSVFAALAIFSAACLVMIHFRFEETLSVDKRRPLALKSVFMTYGALLKDSSFRTPALAGAFSYAAMFGVVAGVGLTGANSNALALAEQGSRAGSASALQGALQFSFSLFSGLIVNSLMFNVLTNLALVIVGCTLLRFGFGYFCEE